MDNSILFTLVSKAYSTDNIGQITEVETTKDVYGYMGSITRAEWGVASQSGFNPSFIIKMFAYDYNGEDVLIINNVRYAIYRTYKRNDTIELYCEKQIGATHG